MSRVHAAAPPITQHTAQVGDLTLAYLTAGAGPPLVLLHGFPQHSNMWRAVMPALAEQFTVIAPDQRGMGGSSVRPAGYDKRTLAADVRALVQGVLGLDRVGLAGYDRGAGVAYANAAAHRDEVERVACSEFVFPGFGYEAFIAPKRGWDDNWQCVAFTVPELCDRFIAGRERELLSWYFHAHAARPGAVATEDPEHARWRQPSPAAWWRTSGSRLSTMQRHGCAGFSVGAAGRDMGRASPEPWTCGVGGRRPVARRRTPRPTTPAFGAAVWAAVRALRRPSTELADATSFRVTSRETRRRLPPPDDMPARSDALPPPDRRAGHHVGVVEGAHAELGLSYDDIARAIGADVSTLHRWRAGDTGPSPVFRHRLTALAELMAAVRGLRRRPGALTVAAWLDTPAVDVPGLRGERPRALLAAGQLERLAALVSAAVATAAPPAPVPPTAPGHGRSGRPSGARA